jgi:chromosome segregation ATPase
MENSNLNLRLTKLEEFCLSLSAHLEGERVLRKEEDEKLKELCDMIAKQLLEIKDIQQNESSQIIFSQIKDQMLNIIDSKIEEKLIDNKNRLEEEKQENYFDNKIEEFNSYRAELDKRIDILENTNNKKMNDIYNKIEEMDVFQNNLKIFNDEVGKKINYLNEMMNHIDQDKNIDNNRLKNVENKIKSITLNYKEKEEKNNIELNNINNNLNFLKNDFANISEKFIKEIEEIKNKLEKYNNIKNKEIANFEEHILGEYENFTKFITSVLNQELDKIKSMNEFLIAILK